MKLLNVFGRNAQAHSVDKIQYVSLSSSPGTDSVSSMASVDLADAAPGKAHHPENNHDDQPDERAWDEGEGIQVPARERLGHGRRFSVTWTKFFGCFGSILWPASSFYLPQNISNNLTQAIKQISHSQHGTSISAFMGSDVTSQLLELSLWAAGTFICFRILQKNYTSTIEPPWRPL